MMKRTFKVDVLSCPKCGGRMRFIALIGQDQPEVVEKILRSMGYEAEMPDAAAGSGARSAGREPRRVGGGGGVERTRGRVGVVGILKS